MKSQVTTTPHSEHRKKTMGEKRAMRRKQTPEERKTFLDKLVRSKYDRDHEESIQSARDLGSRRE